jgi:hypothetical protein
MCPSQVLGGGGGSFWILFNEKEKKISFLDDKSFPKEDGYTHKWIVREPYWDRVWDASDWSSEQLTDWLQQQEAKMTIAWTPVLPTETLTSMVMEFEQLGVPVNNLSKTELRDKLSRIRCIRNRYGTGRRTRSRKETSCPSITVGHKVSNCCPTQSSRKCHSVIRSIDLKRPGLIVCAKWHHQMRNRSTHKLKSLRLCHRHSECNTKIGRRIVVLVVVRTDEEVSSSQRHLFLGHTFFKLPSMPYTERFLFQF